MKLKASAKTLKVTMFIFALSAQRAARKWLSAFPDVLNINAVIVVLKPTFLVMSAILSSYPKLNGSVTVQTT
jgi:hypothetical protein